MRGKVDVSKLKGEGGKYKLCNYQRKVYFRGPGVRAFSLGFFSTSFIVEVCNDTMHCQFDAICALNC